MSRVFFVHNVLLICSDTEISNGNFGYNQNTVSMQILINTDKSVENSDRLQSYFSTELETALSRFDQKITRVEVHFGDENGEKFDLKDKRCLIEVRIANIQPIAVTNHADTVEKAFHGALDKVKAVLKTTFEKQREH